MSDSKPFDMPNANHTWEERGGWLVKRLAEEFHLEPFQAAGIVGNLGYESVGFTKLHEIGQPEGIGGYGWGQWTGPRREAFLNYAQQRGLDWRSDEANYRYLRFELRGDDPNNNFYRTIKEVSHTASLSDAVFSVGQTYERPGGTTETHLPGFDGRLKYAQRALAGAKSNPAPVPAPTDPPIPQPVPPPAVDIRALVVMLQQALNDQANAGLVVDGLLGERTLAAWQDWHGRG